jgi:hypothetical protein
LLYLAIALLDLTLYVADCFLRYSTRQSGPLVTQVTYSAWPSRDLRITVLGAWEPDVAACVCLLGSILLRGYSYRLYEQHNTFDFDFTRRRSKPHCEDEGESLQTMCIQSRTHYAIVESTRSLVCVVDVLTNAKTAVRSSPSGYRKSDPKLIRHHDQIFQPSIQTFRA